MRDADTRLRDLVDQWDADLSDLCSYENRHTVESRAEAETLERCRNGVLAILGRAAERLQPPESATMSDPARNIALLNAPCRWCGYHGADYWQPGTHAVTCPWRAIGGAQERANHLRLLETAHRSGSETAP
jgi:hypothetical protein